MPELHKSDEHYHIHVATINGFLKADLLRCCWQIALGGKGNERGSEALGNVDLKQQKRRAMDSIKQTVGIARYISKYISKSYLETINLIVSGTGCLEALSYLSRVVNGCVPKL